MTVHSTLKAFYKAVRDNVKAQAKAKGIRLSKAALDEIVLQQAADACAGDSQRVLKERLNQLLDMA